jgi:hypothetical protein
MDDPLAYVTNANISLLEEVKLQAQVLIPVLKAFRAELGEKRANQILSAALQDWARHIFQKIGTQLSGSPKEKWAAVNAALTPRIGNAVDFEMLKREPEAVEFNITGCRYADFFRQLGEPELGALLLCDMDVHLAEIVGGPEVELTRTQTIMKGAKYCDFRYRLKTGTAAE